LLPPLALLYSSAAATYRSTARELRRLEAVTRSPLYNHFSETLSGTETIRAMNLQHYMTNKYMTVLDNNQRISFASMIIGLWLSIRLQLIGMCVVGFVSLFTVIAVNSHSDLLNSIVSPQLVGLALAWSLPLTDILSGIIGAFTETEKQLVSVERSVEYMDASTEVNFHDRSGQLTSINPMQRRMSFQSQHPSEDSTPKSSATRAPTPSHKNDLYEPLLLERRDSSSILHFTSAAAVTFNNVTFRYRTNLPAALKSISFTIQPGEHIALCGRTGAGKLYSTDEIVTVARVTRSQTKKQRQ
jgi:ATP-binding cassette subfamily C (CFTR/MRP) protein 10